MVRHVGLLWIAAFLGCAHAGTSITHSTGVDLSHYHRIGVLPFSDPRGQGRPIAEGIDAGLRQLWYDSSDMKTLERILSQYKPDPELGLSLEALTTIRSKISADAIILGDMAPDWSAASVLMIDVETGDQVLRALVKPGHKDQKIFGSSAEIIQETLRVFGGPTAGPRP